MISALRCSFGKEVALCCQEPMMTQVQNSIITHHPSTFIFTVLKMENTGKHNLFPSPDYLALDTRGKTTPSLKAKATSPKATPLTGQKQLLSLSSPESGRTAAVLGENT